MYAWEIKLLSCQMVFRATCICLLPYSDGRVLDAADPDGAARSFLLCCLMLTLDCPDWNRDCDQSLNTQDTLGCRVRYINSRCSPDTTILSFNWIDERSPCIRALYRCSCIRGRHLLLHPVVPDQGHVRRRGFPWIPSIRFSSASRGVLHSFRWPINFFIHC
jgi:hypothetical protein